MRVIYFFVLMTLVHGPCFGLLEQDCSRCNLTKLWNSNQVCTIEGEEFWNHQCPFQGGFRSIRSSSACMEKGVHHAGTCKCPNDCFSEIGRGFCDGNSCKCKEGYQGPDCSLVKCPSNCSNRGECKTLNGIDTCFCEHGYSLNDCSGLSFPLMPPVPLQYPSFRQYRHDKYEENHPIFNSSNILQIRIWLEEKFLNHLLDPSNKWKNDYFPCSVWIFDGKTSEQFNDVGIRLKGDASRNFAKKPWKLDFSKFKEGQELHGMKKISLKTTAFDVSCIRQNIAYDLLYHMGVRRPRGSLALLHVNDISFGIYAAEEAIDEKFVISRFGNEKGNLYKVLHHGWLDYAGDNPKTYQNMTDKYEAKNEASNFEDFTHLVQVLNSSLHSETFDEDIVNVLHVDQWLRALVVEVATGNLDGYNNGKNYFLFRKKHSSKFFYIPHDYDLTLGLPVSINVTQNMTMFNWSPHPLVSRILASKKFERHFVEMFCGFLKEYRISEEGEEDHWLVKRIKMMEEMAGSAAVYDKMHSIDRGYSPEEVKKAAEEPIIRIGEEKEGKPLQWGYNAFFIQPILSFINTQSESSLKILKQCL